MIDVLLGGHCGGVAVGYVQVEYVDRSEQAPCAEDISGQSCVSDGEDSSYPY